MKTINKVIKILVASDFFLNCGWGLLAPVFAIFLVQNISQGDPVAGAKLAGFSYLFYWLTKAILQIPVGNYLDKNHGEKDDFWFLVIGTFLTSFVPLGFLFSSSAWHIYILQILHAVGMAVSLPPWLAIFTRHIDKGKEAFEWGAESTFFSLGAGIAGGLGGVMAAMFGFKAVFIFVSAFNLLSAFLLFFIRKEMLPKDKKLPIMPPVRPLVEP